MKQTSPKRAKKLRAAAPIRQAYLAAHPWCEVGLGDAYTIGPGPDCGGRSVHAHEILTRARGGPIDEETNFMALCNPCHAFIHDHPAWATQHGYLKSAYGGEE